MQSKKDILEKVKSNVAKKTPQSFSLGANALGILDHYQKVFNLADKSKTLEQIILNFDTIYKGSPDE